MSKENKNEVVEQKIVPTKKVKHTEQEEEYLHNKVKDINGNMVYETNKQYIASLKYK